jgi:hypothetical protein
MNLETLRNEFEIGDGSFLVQLRPNFHWDTQAFDRLARAMEEYCRAPRSGDTVERWLAHGFWFVPRYVKMWTSHPNFPRQYPDAYYKQAYRRLDDLAFWFFVGQSPYLEGHVWEPVRPR